MNNRRSDIGAFCFYFKKKTYKMKWESLFTKSLQHLIKQISLGIYFWQWPDDTKYKTRKQKDSDMHFLVIF
jgi:hypothetical protein